MRSSTRKGRAQSARRSLSVEHLEARQLLAADLTGVLPGLEPADVDEKLSTPTEALVGIGQLPQESPPDDGAVVIPTTSAEPRSYDGTGNNLDNPEWGSTDEQLLRMAEAEYGDGVSTPAGADRPNPREISNVMAAQDEDTEANDRRLSAFIYFWGQFLDHDIDLTLPPEENGESFNIPVPLGDEFFDPDDTGTQEIPFTRSRFDENTGTDAGNPREQINQITAWIDASTVYGSDQATADSLRLFEDGKLLTSGDDLPPTDGDGNFLAGDVRANENVELTSMHALFVREHNWWAEQIANENPDLMDQEIYDMARAIVIAEIQAISYNEFLPALLGPRALESYQGYDPTVDPGIATAFSTGGYRLGHSMINDDVEFFGDDGRAVFEEIPLAEAFMNPDILRETGIDSVLKYAASTLSQEVDTQVVDGLRNFLFGAPGQGGLDLASMNIQRGRDHGLADYNTVREAYGLQRVTRFSQISSDRSIQRALKELYGSVDNIDLWVGALSEDHVRGTSVGELTRAILVDQFERLRAADRFWYQNVFSGEELAQLESTTLSDIIQRNTTVTNIQDNAFFLHSQVKGEVYFDTNGNGDQDRREFGLPGIKVELLDDEGEVVATTRTRLRGRYQFDDFDETGDFQVRVQVPAFLSVTSENPQEFLISSGDETVRDVDFGIRLAFWNFFNHRSRTQASPAASADTVFQQLGQATPDVSQLDTVDPTTKEDASESGDDSSGLLDELGEESQDGRDQHDASLGKERTASRVGRQPAGAR